jgi:hypothetical protein
MNELIVRDPDYIRRLQQYPGMTAFSELNGINPCSAVSAAAPARQRFIADNPGYVISITQRIVAEFRYFENYQLPVINALSGINKIYVHSAAGSYELSLLNYSNPLNTHNTYQPKIQVRA